jgi:hypothetical protein
LNLHNNTELQNKKQEAIKQLQKYQQAEQFKNKTDVKFAAIIFIGKEHYEIVEVA